MERDFRRRYPTRMNTPVPGRSCGCNTMNHTLSRAALASLIALVATSGGAQTDEQKFYREQFAGWGGIVFRCIPDVANDATQKQICANAATEARLLAATGKIPFRDVGDKGYFDVSMASDELNGALVLETTLRATQGGNRAIAVSLAATSFYADAIEKSAPADRPEGQPRGGTLELWQRPPSASAAPKASSRKACRMRSRTC